MLDQHLIEVASLLMTHKQSKTLRQYRRTWKPPEDDAIKLNVDGSSKGSPGSSTIGVLACNNLGDWLFGFADHIGSNFPLQTEIRAINQGLQLAWEKGLRRVVVESESSEAVQFICRESSPPPALESLVQESRNLLNRDLEA